MALDSAGDAFAANCNPSYAVISVYDQGLNLLRNIIGLRALALAVDRFGFLYIASCGPGVLVVAPGGNGVEYELKRDLNSACTLAFDSSGDLYVGNNRAVAVYTPTGRQHRMKYLRRITDQVKFPTALTFGPADDLFVSNCPSCSFSSGKHRDWISVYSDNGSQPRREITEGIDGPRLLAVDPDGRLYVANIPLRHGRPQRGSISVYAPGGSKPSRKIADGIDSPFALAIDSSGNLYVANIDASTVTVWSPGGAKLLYTITDGVHDPSAMTFSSS